MGDGRGINIGYTMGTTWDGLKKMIDKEVENGNGRLVEDRKEEIYGVKVLGYQIVFKNSNNRVVEVNPEQYLPMEIDMFRNDLRHKLTGLLD
ncbi:hypothetical protein ES703_25176 [subsurface metagenome]